MGLQRALWGCFVICAQKCVFSPQIAATDVSVVETGKDLSSNHLQLQDVQFIDKALSAK